MPPLPEPRKGRQIRIKGIALRFSYWPMYKGTRRYGLQTSLYATNAFSIIQSAVKAQCPATARAEALAYVSQAEYMLRAAFSSDEWAAKPLLLYYGFMNLAKAYILTREVQPELGKAMHGISEHLRPGGKEVIDAYLNAYPSPGNRGPNVFADFWKAISGHTMSAPSQYNLITLLAQIIAGHRLWSHSAKELERFVNIHDIAMMQDQSLKNIWLVLRVYSGNLSRHKIGHSELLDASNLAGIFREVTSCKDPTTNETLLQFEQIAPIFYTHRPSDNIPDLISPFRHSLWATVTIAAPHRQYYLYMSPRGERPMVLPQLVAAYAVLFYLGSITRYRPQHFDAVLNSTFGALIQEILASQPTQFLYLLASEFARREVTQPETV